VTSIYVVSVHRWGQGQAWEATAAPDRLPELPFLLSSDERFWSVFRGRISFRLSHWAREEFARHDYSGQDVPVGGDG
jgi:hypothetical protein